MSRVIWYLLAAGILVFICLGAPVSARSQARAESLPPQSLTWKQMPSPVTTNLNSVAMLSAQDGWAVGEHGTLLHYNGQDWIDASLAEAINFSSVSMSSTDNGWALGNGSLLYRWNGAAWESVSTPSPSWPVYMEAVSVPNDTSAWVAGGIFVCSPDSLYPDCNPEYALGTISHWNGSAWDNTSIQDVFLSSITMLTDADGWAVGTEVVPGSHNLRSAIFHWNGGYWASVSHPTVEYPGGHELMILEEVTALNAGNVWVSVTDQNSLLHWNGSAWTRNPSPVGGRPSVAVIASNAAWVVGDAGGIARWDGSAWTQAASPVTARLNSVAKVSAYDVWAVGAGGTILHGSSYPIFLPLVLK